MLLQHQHDSQDPKHYKDYTEKIVVCIHNGVTVFKKKKILSFAVTWHKIGGYYAK